MLIPKDEVVWSKVPYLKIPLTGTDEDAEWQYEFMLPAPLSEWDVFSYWEVERTLHMRDNLKHGEILFDIGTEQGWLNLAYAQMVGAENIVLIEPTQEFWPNIRQTWYKNFKEHPLAFYHGLLSDKTTDESGELVDYKGWPAISNGDMIDRNKYQYIHANDENIPEMRLDDMVWHSGIIPDALTMDVEGAEYLILKGAKATLAVYKPKLWVSIHPDMGERDYGIKAQEVHDFLSKLGYVGTHLATDHEEHWFFEVPKK